MPAERPCRVSFVMTQIEPGRARLHRERAPSNQCGGQGEAVLHPVAAGMKFSLDSAPRDRLLAWKTQRVIAQRDIQRCIEFTAGLPGKCFKGPLQSRHARRQGKVWRNLNTSGLNSLAVGHAPVADLADKRSEEHTSELQSRQYLVCRPLLEK